MTIFLAGHDTTANALTWTWYLLSQNPEAEATLHAELDAVLADRTPTVDDLPRLPYTRAVLAESMRLYPPAWIIGRRALADYPVGGYVVPQGGIVILAQVVTQVDPRWFPDPLRFDPARWMPDAPGRPPQRLLPLRRRPAHLHRRTVRLDGGDIAAGGPRPPLAPPPRPRPPRRHRTHHHPAPETWDADDFGKALAEPSALLGLCTPGFLATVNLCRYTVVCPARTTDCFSCQPSLALDPGVRAGGIDENLARILCFFGTGIQRTMCCCTVTVTPPE